MGHANDIIKVNVAFIERYRAENGFGIAFDTETADGSERRYWMDAWIYNDDLEIDWNQYIFFLDDSEDLERRDFQSNPNNWDLLSGLVSAALLDYGHVYQDERGWWHIID